MDFPNHPSERAERLASSLSTYFKEVKKIVGDVGQTGWKFEMKRAQVEERRRRVVEPEALRGKIFMSVVGMKH